LEVEAGAYFKKGDVLISTLGNPFIYNGIITKGVMGCICGMASFGDIGFDCKLWTNVYDGYKKRHVRKAIEEEKKFLAEKIIKAEDSRKVDIIKRYLSEYEYLLDEMPKHDLKPFERVLVRRNNQERWKVHLFSRESGGDNKYECLGGVGFSQCIPYEGVQHGDWVRCVLCGAQMLLPCGADKCPECSSKDTLMWVDENRQEMDAKHLDCLVPIRKLELQEYLSPEILKMEHI
jgi:hypothetical protein